MDTTRVTVTGSTTSSPNDHSKGQRPRSKEVPAPLRHQSADRSSARRWHEHGKLAPYACVCAKAENLPRIILVSGKDTLMPELSRALDPCPLEIRTLKSCLEAARGIGSSTTPGVVFSDVQLPDGDWKQVLQMARQAPARAEVILVSRFVDVRLYLDALEAGAFDFVAPPFHTVELGYIIVNAIYACFKHRTHRFSGNVPDVTV
jgi:CheY-like chemotaxis protein